MTVTTFQDLPLADRDRAWDGGAAEKRVRAWADAEDGPNAKYRDAHLWHDPDNADNFTGYKLLYADVVDGHLKAVPRGIIAIAGILDGARGGVDIPSDEVDRAKNHVKRYYDKMGDEVPWEK
jgi:hypothetical protein